jgi:hypothetical protein
MESGLPDIVEVIARSLTESGVPHLFALCSKTCRLAYLRALLDHVRRINIATTGPDLTKVVVTSTVSVEAFIAALQMGAKDLPVMVTFDGADVTGVTEFSLQRLRNVFGAFPCTHTYVIGEGVRATRGGVDSTHEVFASMVSVSEYVLWNPTIPSPKPCPVEILQAFELGLKMNPVPRRQLIIGGDRITGETRGSAVAGILSTTSQCLSVRFRPRTRGDMVVAETIFVSAIESQTSLRLRRLTRRQAMILRRTFETCLGTAGSGIPCRIRIMNGPNGTRSLFITFINDPR